MPTDHRVVDVGFDYTSRYQELMKDLRVKSLAEGDTPAKMSRPEPVSYISIFGEVRYTKPEVCLQAM